VGGGGWRSEERHQTTKTTRRGKKKGKTEKNIEFIGVVVYIWSLLRL